MTDRISVTIPESIYPTRIEVYKDGELNRWGGVQPGVTETKVKLPIDTPVDECMIRVFPCREDGQPIGQGYILVDGELRPYQPKIMEALKKEEEALKKEAEEPHQPDSDETCENTGCESDESCDEGQDSEISEVAPCNEAEVVLDRPVELEDESEDELEDDPDRQ